jgi:hypothetical protein
MIFFFISATGRPESVSIHAAAAAGWARKLRDTAAEGMPATAGMPEAAVKSETQGCQQEQGY